MLVVVGSGPGIGSATAAVFASHGFSKVVLIARNADRLREDCRVVEDAARQAGKSVHVGCYAVDVTDTNAYRMILDKVAKFGSLECVFFNAARVEQSVLLEKSVEDVEYDFKVCLLSTTARFGPILTQIDHQLGPIHHRTVGHSPTSGISEEQQSRFTNLAGHQ